MWLRQVTSIGILGLLGCAVSVTTSYADEFDDLDWVQRAVLEATNRWENRWFLAEEMEHPEPAPPAKEVEVWLDHTGLVINDTDESHRIVLVYVPTMNTWFDVVIYDQTREIYRKRFRTNDVLAVGYTGVPWDFGLCRIYGRGGDDEIIYMLDIPAHIHGGDGHDEIRSGDHWDTVTGGRGDDVLHGSWGSDFIAGGPGNDKIFGGLDYDVLDGGDGDDLINSRDKVAELPLGGPGRDVFVVDRNNQIDWIFDFDPTQDTAQ